MLIFLWVLTPCRPVRTYQHFGRKHTVTLFGVEDGRYSSRNTALRYKSCTGISSSERDYLCLDKCSN